MGCMRQMVIMGYARVMTVISIGTKGANIR
jgi:hypothetical protein